MAANAKRGLELRRKHGRGGTAVGVARARDISNRKTLSPETVRRMHAFFSRHEKNKAGGEDDAGYIAWLLWGGDSGQGWAKRKVEQMDKSENQRSETYKEIAQRLGSVAKFAITKEQIRGASREELHSIEQRLMALAKSGDKNAAALLDYIEDEYNDRYRGTHSRPGAKARFGYADAKVVGGDIVWPSGMTLKILSHSTLEQKSKEMQDAIKRNRSAWIADYKLRGPKGATYSLDVYANGTYILTPHNNPRPMLRGQLQMSRPGAKAKFGLLTSVSTLPNTGSVNNTAKRFLERLQRVNLNDYEGFESFHRNLSEALAGVVRNTNKSLKNHEYGEWTGKDLATIIQREMGRSAALTRTAEAWLGVSMMSRPGAKAMFASPVQREEQGRYLTAMHKLSAKAAVLAADLRTLSDRAQQYAKMLDSDGVVTRELIRRMDDLLHSFMPYGKIPMSRLGAKAKMARWEESHADGWGDLSKSLTATINGTRWTIVVDASTGKGQLMRSSGGAPKFVKEGAVDQLKRYAETTRASRPGAKAMMAVHAGTLAMAQANYNRAKRDLDEAQERLDTFLRVGQSEQRIAQAERGVELAEERFKEAERALRSLHARPGAKARMAKPQFRVRKLHNGYLAVDLNQGSGWERYDTTHEDSWDGLEPYERGYQKAYDRGLRWSGGAWRIPSIKSSRPGAKVTNAVREGCKISAEDEACLKMMAAADEKVSDKIRTLIAEGKPQKQAVAIALDLKRRGEL